MLGEGKNNGKPLFLVVIFLIPCCVKLKTWIGITILECSILDMRENT
jgi:hypothetical protein